MRRGMVMGRRKLPGCRCIVVHRLPMKEAGSLALQPRVALLVHPAHSATHVECLSGDDASGKVSWCFAGRY